MQDSIFGKGRKGRTYPILDLELILCKIRFSGAALAVGCLCNRPPPGGKEGRKGRKEVRRRRTRNEGRKDGRNGQTKEGRNEHTKDGRTDGRNEQTKEGRTE